MKAAFFVHGFVQGVGYRYFVKKVADSLGVKGIVENREDGSVLVIAECDPDILEKFEADINVSTEHGIQVLRIERIDRGMASFPKIAYDSSKFAIRK